MVRWGEDMVIGGQREEGKTRRGCKEGVRGKNAYVGDNTEAEQQRSMAAADSGYQQQTRSAQQPLLR